MANTTLYVGPIATGARRRRPLGVRRPDPRRRIYAALWLTTSPYRDPARRPRHRADAAAAASADQDEIDDGCRGTRRPQPGGTRMTWRMPAETAPHERTWMAFPRDGTHARRRPRVEREEAYADLDRGRARRRRVRAGHDGRRPDRARRARGACCRATSSILEAPLDDFWMRDIGATFVLDDERPGVLGARRLDLQRLGRAEVGRAGSKDREIGRFVTEQRRRRARVVDARERGRRHPRRRRGHRARHRDRAARPAPQPVRRQGARRGRARPHDRRHHGDLAAARPHPRLRGLRHARPRRHRRDDPVARHAAAARPAEPRAPRLRGHARAARVPRRSSTDAAGRALRHHRPARARQPCATTRASSTGAT